MSTVYRPVTASDVATLRIEQFLDVARQAIADHGQSVAAELSAMARRSEHDRAAHALVFALVSPRLRFASNVAVTDPLLRAIRAHESDEVLIGIMRSHRVYLGMSHRAILRNRELILNANAAHMERSFLLSRYGFGPKTSALALALWNPSNPVFTLDVWMLRGIFHTAGIGTFTDNWSINTTMYRKIETLFIFLADTLGVEPFLLQWSLWNVWRRNANKHMVHTDLI